MYMQLLQVQLEATEVAAPGRMRDTSRAGEKPARLLLHAHPRRIARTTGDSAAGRVEVVVIEEGTAGGGDAAGDGR